MSERASTSSSLLPDFGGSGEASTVAGVEIVGGRGVPLVDVWLSSFAAGVLPLPSELAFSFATAVLSASLFSRVPRSVAPARSSSVRIPDSRNNDSIRPSRFSRPSMYLCLLVISINLSRGGGGMFQVPFWRIALLFDLRKDAFGLVILAVRACRHLSVALDLLLSAHVASLPSQ